MPSPRRRSGISSAAALCLPQVSPRWSCSTQSCRRFAITRCTMGTRVSSVTSLPRPHRWARWRIDASVIMSVRKRMSYPLTRHPALFCAGVRAQSWCKIPPRRATHCEVSALREVAARHGGSAARALSLDDGVQKGQHSIVLLINVSIATDRCQARTQSSRCSPNSQPSPRPQRIRTASRFSSNSPRESAAWTCWRIGPSVDRQRIATSAAPASRRACRYPQGGQVRVL